jgi:hypothetical protein
MLSFELCNEKLKIKKLKTLDTKLHSNVSLSLSLTSVFSEPLWFVNFYVRQQPSINPCQIKITFPYPDP